MTLRSCIVSACLVLAGLLAGCSNPGEPDEFPRPAIINECETNTAEVCGTWTLDGRNYNAVWSQNARAVIIVDRFDADSVVFSRTDIPGSTSYGMTAVYRGRVQNRAVQNGVVTWRDQGLTVQGTWTANW